MPNKVISKSKYLNGLQCLKYLWIAKNQPERIPEADATTQFRFDQGHLVGELAKKLYPEGINVPTDDFGENIRQTRQLIKERRPLFEAGITADGVYCRPDILNPVGDDQWDIIEVKSSTKLKDVNVHDVAFQKYCCEQYGLKIRTCFLMHVNSDYIRNGELELDKLLTTEDITEEVLEASVGIEERIREMLEIIREEEYPEVRIGRHCSDPYGCPLVECWEFLPPDSVFTLYRGGKKSYELLDEGILDIRSIPGNYPLNKKQLIQRDSIISGEAYIDGEGIKEFLSKLEYPLYFLDFETFGTAVPMFDGTSPYQNIPFQFSLHKQETQDSVLEHFSYLADGPGDPRLDLLSELIRAIGEQGSIVVYNQSFESGVLAHLADSFPDCGTRVDNVQDRLVDLLVPFRNFHYYHPAQRGSASMKKVLPAVTGKTYEGMEIGKGDDASVAFYSITYGEATSEEKAKVRWNLEKYCALDTEGMVLILDTLRSIT